MLTNVIDGIVRSCRWRLPSNRSRRSVVPQWQYSSRAFLHVQDNTEEKKNNALNVGEIG